MDGEETRLYTPTCSEASNASDKGELYSDEKESHENEASLISELVKMNTRENSSVDEHKTGSERFTDSLQTTTGESRYKKAHVLLMSWEDGSYEIDWNIGRLAHVFSHLYHFDVERFEIPQSRPANAAAIRVSKFLQNDGSDTLLIVYYAGHARLSKQANDLSIWAP